MGIGARKVFVVHRLVLRNQMADEFVDEALLKLVAQLSIPKLLNVLFYTLVYATHRDQEGVLWE